RSPPGGGRPSRPAQPFATFGSPQRAGRGPAGRGGYDGGGREDAPAGVTARTAVVADGFYQDCARPGSRRSLAAVRTYLAGAAMNLYYVAAIWLAMALLASVISIPIAVPAAFVWIVVGPLAGHISG